MNIAILIDSLSGGGSENVVGRLALGLAGRGHFPYVYCLKTADVALERFQAAGVVVREVDSRGYDLTLPWRLGHWMWRDGIEVVHAHCCAGLAISFPAAMMLSLPLLHVRHGWPLGKPSKYELIADRLSRHIELVGINCESGRAHLPHGRVANEAVCLPNGFDSDMVEAPVARLGIEELCGQALPGPVIFSAAYFRAEKGIRGLVRAFALVQRDWPDANLVCVGGVIDRQYQAAVHREVRELGLDDRVHFPGLVTDAHRLMPGADVFCLASLTEAMPNVIIEAMAQRVPIVSTAVGDVGSLTKNEQTTGKLLRHNESALLTPPNDPAALADALRYALSDPAAGRRRAEEAYRRYQRDYTTSSMVNRYEAAYVECLRRRGRSPDVVAGRVHSARKPAVLMLGPAPPSTGGMVTSINLMMRGPLREKYRLYRVNSPVKQGCGGGSRALGAIGKAVSCLAGAGRHLAALTGLILMLVGKRISILHIHTCSYFTFYRNLLDLCLAKCLGRAVVMHIRGGRFEEFCETRGGLGRWLIRRGLEWADAVIVLSESWREKLRPYAGSASLHVVANACDTTEFANSRTRSPTSHDRPDPNLPCRFLFLGEISKAKGVGDLIEATRRLRECGMSFVLQIAGAVKQTERCQWEHQVIQAGLADFTEFPGAVQGRAKTHLFATADCLVHPSHVEGMPNVMLEAGAAGLPVIATAVGAVPEMLGQTRLTGDGNVETPFGILVPPREPEMLARAMIALASDVESRWRMGQRWHDECKGEYSQDRLAERIEHIYAAVLGRVNLEQRAHNPRKTGDEKSETCMDCVPCEVDRCESRETATAEVAS